MKNCGGACGAYLKTLPTTFHYPQNFSIAATNPPFHHRCNPFVIPRPPHHPNSKSTANGGHHNYSLFIFHHSSFIIFATNPAIPTITAARALSLAPHYISAPLEKGELSRQASIFSLDILFNQHSLVAITLTFPCRD